MRCPLLNLYTVRGNFDTKRKYYKNITSQLLEAGVIGKNTANTSNTSGSTFVSVATNIFDSSHGKLDESFLKNQY
jgi:hypothetical protein